MKIETKYCCSFCDEKFWFKDECMKHELEYHPCLHCRNLCVYNKNMNDGTIDCDCEAHYFNHNHGGCRYHVEGEPNMEFCMEGENV